MCMQSPRPVFLMLLAMSACGGSSDPNSDEPYLPCGTTTGGYVTSMVITFHDGDECFNVDGTYSTEFSSFTNSDEFDTTWEEVCPGDRYDSGPGGDAALGRFEYRNIANDSECTEDDAASASLIVDVAVCDRSLDEIWAQDGDCLSGSYTLIGLQLSFVDRFGDLATWRSFVAGEPLTIVTGADSPLESDLALFVDSWNGFADPDGPALCSGSVSTAGLSLECGWTEDYYSHSYGYYTVDLTFGPGETEE